MSTWLSSLLWGDSQVPTMVFRVPPQSPRLSYGSRGSKGSSAPCQYLQRPLPNMTKQPWSALVRPCHLLKPKTKPSKLGQFLFRSVDGTGTTIATVAQSRLRASLWTPSIPVHPLHHSSLSSLPPPHTVPIPPGWLGKLWLWHPSFRIFPAVSHSQYNLPMF